MVTIEADDLLAARAQARELLAHPDSLDWIEEHPDEHGWLSGAAEKLLDKAVDEYLVARNAAAEAKTVLAKVPITDDGLSPEHRAVRRGELMMDNARHNLWDASIAYHEAASAAMDRIWDAERAVKPLDQETMERKERRAYKQAVSALKKEN